MLAEHGDGKLNMVTLNAVTAASKLGDVSVLVTGADMKSIAQQVDLLTDAPPIKIFKKTCLKRHHFFLKFF